VPRLLSDALRRIRFRLALVALLTAAGAIAASPAHAQRADSARAGVARTATDSVRPRPRPPLSPRRAFLYSLALPGYSQSVLNRPTAGALFMLTESIALVMLRESAADLRQARRFRTDSLVVIGYEPPPSGAPITQVSAYNDRLIDIRRGHVEDWIAFIIANHLFAAADAYVAAHLWDLPTQISVESRPDGAALAARVHW
jgi:hypothetical protein